MKKKPHVKIDENFSSSPLLSIVSWLGLVWAVFVVVKYLQKNPIWPILEQSSRWFPGDFPSFSVLLGYCLTLLWSLGLLSGALTIGFWISRLWTAFSSSEKLIFSFIVGMGALSYIVFFLGVFQLFSPILFKGLFAAGVLFFLASFSKGLGVLIKEGTMEIWNTLKSSPFLLLVPFVMVFLLAGLMIFVPECFYDSLVYHLGVPRWYLLEGGIKKFPNLHSNYPLTIQMLYTFCLALSGDAAAKFVHFFCGAMIASLFIVWGKRKYNSTVGVYAAVIFLTMPMSQTILWTTGVDLGTTMFALAAVWVWQSQVGIRGVVFSGIFAGLSYGSKLTGGVILFSLCVGIAIQSLFQKKDVSLFLKEISIFTGVSFLVLLPWLIKAYLFTGNPIFPFLFGGLDQGRTAQFFSESKGVTPHGFWGWLTLLWPLTFEGLSSLSYPGSAYLAFFPILIGILFLKRAGSATERNVFIVSLVSMVALAFVNRLTRYWMPYLAITTIPLAWALFEAHNNSFFRKTIIHLLIGFIGFSNVLYAGMVVFNSYQPWPVLLGKESAEDYKSYTHPGLNPYPSVKMTNWAFENLPKGSKILILGEEKIAFNKLPFLASGVYDESPLLAWMAEAHDADQVYAQFRERGLTHIMVNLFEGKRLLGYRTFDWPEEKMGLFCRFWESHVRLIYQDYIPEKMDVKPPLFMYEVLPREEAQKKPISWNPIFWLFEEYHVPMETIDARAKKIDWVNNMNQKFPNVLNIQHRYQELSAKESK